MLRTDNHALNLMDNVDRVRIIIADDSLRNLAIQPVRDLLGRRGIFASL